jgi:hypothetical protein
MMWPVGYEQRPQAEAARDAALLGRRPPSRWLLQERTDGILPTVSHAL